MQYPIFIHKDPDSDYGVIVPDLPGCFSAGSTIEDAIESTHEAIECHLEGLLLDGDPIPLKQPLEKHLDNPEFSDLSENDLQVSDDDSDIENENQ